MKRFNSKIISIVILSVLLVLLICTLICGWNKNLCISPDSVFNAIVSIVGFLITLIGIIFTVEDKDRENKRRYAPILLVRTNNPHLSINDGYANSKIDNGSFIIKFVLQNSGENIAWNIKLKVFMNDYDDFDLNHLDRYDLVNLCEDLSVNVFSQDSYSTIRIVANLNQNKKLNNRITKKEVLYLLFCFEYEGVDKEYQFKTYSNVTMKCIDDNDDKIKRSQEDGYYITHIDNTFVDKKRN